MHLLTHFPVSLLPVDTFPCRCCRFFIQILFISFTWSFLQFATGLHNPVSAMAESMGSAASGRGASAAACRPARTPAATGARRRGSRDVRWACSGGIGAVACVHAVARRSEGGAWRQYHAVGQWQTGRWRCGACTLYWHVG
jgi:hypothetical protein